MATYVQTVDVGHLDNGGCAPSTDSRSSARLDRTTTLALTLDVLRCRGLASF